jgi:multidrug efflux pump subunit AcrA (membrane-fusion protein)
MRTMGWLTLLLLAAAGGWCVRGWQHFTDPSMPTSAQTNTARVMRSRIEQTVKARGIVKPAPNALIRVGFPMPKDVARRIQTMKFVEGDAVKVGDELAMLDHADLLATLTQLKADAVVVENRLQASRTLEPVEVNVSRAIRDQAKVQAVQAQRNYERVSKLESSNAISQQVYETTLSDMEVAKAKLENAEASLLQVKTRFQTDITTLEAQVEQAKAAIKSVEVQIDWSTIRSPIDGVVFAVHQRPGELTSNVPNAPVLTLLEPKQLQVHLYIDEADFGKVRLDQEVKLRVEAHAGETVQGKVIRLLPQPILQENVVYYLAVVEVDEAKRSLLRSEMTALAHIQVGNNEPILWLPLAAVKSRADGWYVRLMTDGGPIDRAVHTGIRSDGRVEIQAGLVEGDEVLLDQ